MGAGQPPGAAYNCFEYRFGLPGLKNIENPSQGLAGIIGVRGWTRTGYDIPA